VYLSLRIYLKIVRDIIITVYGPSYKVPIIFSHFNKVFHFLYKFSKGTTVSNFMKIRPAEAELFHADRWADTTKLIVAFRNFAKAPNMQCCYVSWINLPLAVF